MHNNRHIITCQMHNIKLLVYLYLIFVNILSGFAQQVEIEIPSKSLSITTFFGANCDDRLQTSNIYPLNKCIPVPDNEGLYQKLDCSESASTYSTTLCADSQCNNCDSPLTSALQCSTNPNNQSTLYSCPSLPDSFVNHTIIIAQYSSSNCDASSLHQLQYVSPLPTCINNKSTNNGTAVSSYYTCDENGVVARNCDARSCQGNCAEVTLPLDQCNNGLAYTCLIKIPAPSSPAATTTFSAIIAGWVSLLMLLM